MVDKLLEENRELKQDLQQRIEDNANMYATLCNTLMQLKEANKVIKNVARLMTCDPKVMKTIVDPDFCVDQEALEQCNKYIEKWEVKDE